MSVQVKVPETIRLHRASRVLELGYADGEHYSLGCEYLRVYSPSAEVRGHGAGQETLQTGKRLVTIERIETELGPEQLLDVCKAAEAERGRPFALPRHSPRPPAVPPASPPASILIGYAGLRDDRVKPAVEALRDAERSKTPLLGYFYSPQWLLSEVELAHIPLPPYTPGCDANPKTVACDYQPYDLDKILNREFAYSGSPAAELIQNFSWTNADQNQVASDITAKKLTPQAAAQKWLDSHPQVWRKWLPASP